jgi:mannosyltransferase OCH1-like enzyme
MIGRSIFKIIDKKEMAEARKNINSIKQGKPTFSSEAQIFHYIYMNIKKYKNIRYDFNAAFNSPTNMDAYFHVKIQRANIIPKCILQIAIGDSYVGSLPLEDVKQHILQNHNTEYEYTLLTDDACKKFLKESFPEYSSLYTRLQKPQYKSDLIRYLYLYKNGGYYIDIDLLPLLPLYTIFEAAKSAPLFFTVGAHTNSKKNTFELCNGFIGAKAGNPIFLELVKLMEQEPNPEDYGMNVKRLYKTIASRHSMTPFQTENSIYLFREVQHMGKYYIVNKKEIIVHSNGHGYPQKKV